VSAAKSVIAKMIYWFVPLQALGPVCDQIMKIADVVKRVAEVEEAREGDGTVRIPAITLQPLTGDTDVKLVARKWHKIAFWARDDADHKVCYHVTTNAVQNTLCF
jgi:hypothetical protein